MQWVRTNLSLVATKNGIDIIEDMPAILGLPKNIRFSWEISQSTDTITKIRCVLLPSAASIQLTSTDYISDLQIVKNLWARLLNPILSLWRRINQNNSILTGKSDSSSSSNTHLLALKRASIVDIDSFIEALKLEYAFGVTLVVF